MCGSEIWSFFFQILTGVVVNKDNTVLGSSAFSYFLFFQFCFWVNRSIVVCLRFLVCHADKNMASPAWLTQEMQPPTSQAPSSSGPSTPIAAASAPGAGTPGLMQGTAQARYANAPGYVIPAPSFSYGVLPNAPTPSGSLQQSASSSVSIDLFCLSDF